MWHVQLHKLVSHFHFYVLHVIYSPLIYADYFLVCLCPCYQKSCQTRQHIEQHDGHLACKNIFYTVKLSLLGIATQIGCFNRGFANLG